MPRIFYLAVWLVLSACTRQHLEDKRWLTNLLPAN